MDSRSVNAPVQCGVGYFSCFFPLTITIPITGFRQSDKPRTVVRTRHVALINQGLMSQPFRQPSPAYIGP